MKKVTVLFIFIIYMLSACKKDALDTRRIPDGTKVWLNGKVNYTDLVDHGIVSKPPLTVVSLYPQSNFNMNFYVITDGNTPALTFDVQDNVLKLTP